MQSAEGGVISARSDDRNNGDASIVSELVSLIEHARASIKLIESAITMEPASSDPEISADVVVLHDVTPRYQNAKAALNTCNTKLEVTLHLLRDIKTSPHGTNESAAYELRSGRLFGRA
jgi:glycine cleavage system regulatory protein